MGVKNVQPEEDIPRQVLNQLAEHTVGGFVLFYFNNKTGMPEHIFSCDTPAHCLAIQKYMSDWSTAMQAVYIDNNKARIHNIIAQGNAKQSEENGEGEEPTGVQ